MLNSTTKNRINTCRDILVGKIPDPKGQIDQITNALVYKFMDDQDRMSRELDYNAQFFTDDYEKYAWSKLFDTKLTNQDRANLYIEGLDKLSKADHLPDLFKQIFKDAYLPFRDANTIVMFLTEINGFDYHHSEELGNAFEYLLSIMGSQGDAGQFRTPRHIIEFLVDVVDPQKSETILDPACGTAGFLVEAFKHISGKGDIGVQDIAKLAESITGVDIDPGMAKIARVNLYLHGFKTPKITENDTLTNEKLWGTKYDVILANPPFMTPKGGIQPHDKFAIRANRAEVLFTDYIAEHLRLHGRAGIIVPEGIIFQSSNAYKDLRKMLVDDGYLWAVVSLPAGCFNPYSGVKTTILFLDRNRAKQNNSILFVKIKNDGYDLGAQRREGGKNDLPKALEILNIYKENPNLLESHPELVSGSSNIAHIVEKSRIMESGSYNLSGDRYIIGSSPTSTEYEMVELGEVCDIFNGSTPKRTESEYWENGNIPWFTIEDMRKQGRIIKHTEQKITEKGFAESSVRLLPEQSVLLCCTASIGEYAYTEVKLTTNQQFNGLVTKDKLVLLPKYLFWIISKFKNELERMSGKATFSFVSVGTLKKMQIPLPPLEIQEQIVAELDGYQRIVDGASAVVDNYKPTIKIDPEWEIVKLGEVCETSSGGTPLKSKPEFYENGKIPWLGSGEVSQGYIFKSQNFISESGLKGSSAKLFPVDSVLIAMYGATVGQVGLLKFESTTNQAVCAIFPNSKFIPEFLYFLLKSKKEYLISLSVGGAQPNISQQIIRNLEIPLPPLEIQQSIVERIEEEQRLVDANRRLIEIYEGKIREKMDEVWGVEK